MDETKEYGDPMPDPADAQTANPEAAAKPAAEEKPDKGKKAKKDKADKDGAQLEALTEKLEKAEQELEATKDQYQRMLAEYANYKRRTEQEKEQIGQFSRGEMLKALLPTVDNLERRPRPPTAKSIKRAWTWSSASSTKRSPGWVSRRSPAAEQPFDPRNGITP